ncbi:MAG: UvrD-helicase domain-containing protein [Candidatus Margulisiibacteriota bacterium]|nr:UvrD-helicase domain-containing protein [Candidatus Margulisiibacteriota bacterium]
MDYQDFVLKEKSLLVAPAGFGKTYTIAKCLEFTQGRQLVLTHTQAGVASLREKIKSNGIDPRKYRIQTIMSYAQKYVNAFYVGKDVPDQETKAYWPFILEKATALLRLKLITDIIKATYCGLFVDEYQDCTISQHKFIASISSNMPTHILGDPLQGIFDFNKEKLVIFDEDLKDYIKNKVQLTEPQRWMRGNNLRLGECLHEIRGKLERRENLDLGEYDSVIEVEIAGENSSYISHKKIWDLIDGEDSLLILHPDSFSIGARLRITKIYRNLIYLVESIDSGDFYKLAKMLDSMSIQNVGNILKKISYKLFNSGELDKWFSESPKKYFKDKTVDAEQKKVKPISELFGILKVKTSFSLFSMILREIYSLANKKCFRKELFFDLCTALNQADENTSVYNAMKTLRNHRRIMGRKIYGKCIGTTLLTKGLEADVVVVLDAHKFKDPKNIYVALTRASKKLVVYSRDRVLSPY